MWGLGGLARALKPQTLETLNPKPQTLETLNPKPQTLETLNPKPQTLETLETLDRVWNLGIVFFLAWVGLLECYFPRFSFGNGFRAVVVVVVLVVIIIIVVVVVVIVLLMFLLLFLLSYTLIGLVIV